LRSIGLIFFSGDRTYSTRSIPVFYPTFCFAGSIGDELLSSGHPDWRWNRALTGGFSYKKFLNIKQVRKSVFVS
jgi:hypothetical protein